MPTNKPGQSVELLQEVVACLAAAHIPYAVIGALAASFHGIVRASLDADLVVAAPPRLETLQTIVASLTPLGYEVVLREGDLGDPIAAMIRVTDSFANQVDLLFGILGMSPDLFQRVKPAVLLGKSIAIVGLEDFIAMKIFARGPQDLCDARGVLAVSKELVNMTLLQKITAGYGAEATKDLERIVLEG